MTTPTFQQASTYLAALAMTSANALQHAAAIGYGDHMPMDGDALAEHRGVIRHTLELQSND